MEVMIDEEYDDDDVRNEIIDHIIATKRGVPPFTYVGKTEDGQYVHYKLNRAEVLPFIERDIILYTLHQLAETLWCRNPVYVHGDLTKDNMIVHEGQLFIIDFEPGQVKKCGLSDPNAIDYIFEDIYDFLRSIRAINQNHKPDYNLGEIDPRFQPFIETIDKIEDWTREYVNQEELTRTMIGLVKTICPFSTGGRKRRGRKSRKRIR